MEFSPLVALGALGMATALVTEEATKDVYTYVHIIILKVLH